jgi:hypothetical protein
MTYYKLDINEFYDSKYEKLNKSSGVGGMGFITSKQSIHLFNDKGYDKSTHQQELGIGDHDDISRKVLTDIYGISEKCVDRKLYDLISIKYWNSEIFKLIVMYFPKTITLAEYEHLKDLRLYYEYLFSHQDIRIGAYEFGDNSVEYEPAVKSVSDLNPIIDYARDRLDVSLERSAKEKILKY